MLTRLLSLSDAFRYCDSLSGRVVKRAHLGEDLGYCSPNAYCWFFLIRAISRMTASQKDVKHFGESLID